MPRLATTLRRRAVSLAGRSRGQMDWRLEYGHSRTYHSVGRGAVAEFCSPSSVTSRKTASPGECEHHPDGASGDQVLGQRRADGGNPR